MKNIKNVVIISDSAEINGGAAKIAIQSALCLAKENIKVYFFCGKPPKDTKLIDSGINIISTNQCDILHEHNRIKAIIQGLWNFKAQRELARLLNSLNPDNTIIHIHVWCKILSHSIFKSISDHNFKAVITLHDYFTVCPNGGLYNYKQGHICRLKPGQQTCLYTNCDTRNYLQKIYRYLRLKIQNYYLNRLESSAIVISKFSEKILNEADGLSKYERVYYIPNIVDSFSYNKSIIVNFSKYLFIGRLEEDKGIRLFCETLSKLGLKGIVIGTGYLFNELQEKYSNIEFVGWVKPSEIPKFVSECKALIVCSLWYETFGLVTLEMQSLGIPSIVPNNHASSDFIQDGINGYIYESGSIESLSEAIKKMERNEMNKLHYNTLMHYDSSLYSENIYKMKLLNVYNQILYGK